MQAIEFFPFTSADGEIHLPDISIADAITVNNTKATSIKWFWLRAPGV